MAQPRRRAPAALPDRLAAEAGLRKGELLLVARGEDGRVRSRRCPGSGDAGDLLARMPLLLRGAAELQERYRPPGTAGPGLPAEAVALLEEAGVRSMARDGGARELSRSRTAYEDLLLGSLGVAQAARRLEVNESRIRQRLLASPPTLFGIKIGGGWLLPAFQFGPVGLVPGLDRVLAALPRDLGPLAIASWFTAPAADLSSASGKPHSPLDWLRSGKPVDEVLELAAGL